MKNILSILFCLVFIVNASAVDVEISSSKETNKEVTVNNQDLKIDYICHMVLTNSEIRENIITLWSELEARTNSQPTPSSFILEFKISRELLTPMREFLKEKDLHIVCLDERVPIVTCQIGIRKEWIPPLHRRFIN